LHWVPHFVGAIKMDDEEVLDYLEDDAAAAPPSAVATGAAGATVADGDVADVVIKSSKDKKEYGCLPFPSPLFFSPDCN